MTRIELPFPPSNHEVFKKHKGKHLSERYRAWRDAAGWELKRQHPTKITGRVSVVIELVAPNEIRRDADNFNKGPIDLLVAHGIIEADDRRILRNVLCRWVEAGPPCTVCVLEQDTWEPIGDVVNRVLARIEAKMRSAA